MEKTFSTLAELRTEIYALKGQRVVQEHAIKEKFSSPGAIFSTITGLFKGHSDDGPGKKPSFLSELSHGDLITNIARVALPMLLNTFVFRKSGFITKAIVTFLSQKAAKKVDTDLVSGIAEKVKGLFSMFKSRKTKRIRRDTKDYGIPPDSETY